MKTCDAAIRPFPNDTEVRCDGEHDGRSPHEGTLRDYAYPGSVTKLSWGENDRRNFHGEWPGRCFASGGGGIGSCVLPDGHSGRHAW